MNDEALLDMHRPHDNPAICPEPRNSSTTRPPLCGHDVLPPLPTSRNKYRLLRASLPTRQTFFDDIRALTRYLCFESLEALRDFMLRGLEIDAPDSSLEFQCRDKDSGWAYRQGASRSQDIPTRDQGFGARDEGSRTRTPSLPR